MQRIGETMTLWHIVTLLQDPWLGFGWNITEFLIVTGIMVVAITLSARLFRCE